MPGSQRWRKPEKRWFPDIFLPEVGFLALLLSLGVNVLTPSTVFAGVRLYWPTMMRLAHIGILAQLALLLLAFGVLTYCFLISDFSVTCVIQHSYSLLSWELKLAAVQGDHGGSLLLQVLLPSAWSALLTWHYRRQTNPLFPLTLAVLSLMLVALLLFIVLWSGPSVRIFPPAIEGRDLSLMLQYPGLIFHPPLLYLGYGDLMIAASVALASLLCGGFDDICARVCWRWVLPGWSALTAGIILGFWWVYYELGWSGWWFWDPMENVSLLPRLSATVLPRNLSLTRQREIFRHQSLLLAAVILMPSLPGTLIIRPGILVSVHAFILDNARTVPLFSLSVLISLASLVLYGWRARNGDPVMCFSGLSREMLIFATLLPLCAVLLIVLMGTLCPTVYDLLGWGRLFVGTPYSNHATLPFGLSMLVVAVLATFVSDKHVQLPALVAHVDVLLFAAGTVVPSVSRQEISLNLQPDQQVTLAGYTLHFKRLDLQAKGNHTSKEAIVTLSDHQ